MEFLECAKAPVAQQDIHEIVKILIEDVYLLECQMRFYNSLKLPFSNYSSVEGSSIYNFFSRCLQTWTQTNGSNATFEILIKTMRREGWNLVADNILKYVESNVDLIMKRQQAIVEAGSILEALTNCTSSERNQWSYQHNAEAQPGQNTTSRASRRSEVDKTRIVDDNSWVVSLFRNSHANKHTEHVFIVLEGCEDNMSKITFMDFIPQNTRDIFIPGRYKGKIRIVDYKSRENKPLLYSCEREMMKIEPGIKTTAVSYNIDKLKGLELLKSVSQAKELKNVPPYNVAGSDALAAYWTATASSKELGENCFTWAKRQLRNLNDDMLSEVLPCGPLDFLIVIPSQSIRKESLSNNSFRLSLISVAFTILAVASLILAIKW